MEPSLQPRPPPVLLFSLSSVVGRPCTTTVPAPSPTTCPTYTHCGYTVYHTYPTPTIPSVKRCPAHTSRLHTIPQAGRHGLGAFRTPVGYRTCTHCVTYLLGYRAGDLDRHGVAHNRGLFTPLPHRPPASIAFLNPIPVNRAVLSSDLSTTPIPVCYLPPPPPTHHPPTPTTLPCLLYRPTHHSTFMGGWNAATV